MGSRTLRSIAAAWAVGAGAAAGAQCEALPVTVPGRDATINEARPEIAWRAVAGAKSYRVQIESRVPEGRVIERIDTQVSSNRFVPARPLADERAAVKILVTADCAGTPNLAEQPAWFFVDAAAACAPAKALAFPAGGVEWDRTAGATRYQVEVYSTPEGRLLSRVETPLTSAALPRGPAQMLIAVRPQCGTVVGPAIYGLAPPQR